jgi:hypothetical protein
VLLEAIFSAVKLQRSDSCTGCSSRDCHISNANIADLRPQVVSLVGWIRQAEGIWKRSAAWEWDAVRASLFRHLSTRDFSHSAKNPWVPAVSRRGWFCWKVKINLVKQLKSKIIAAKFSGLVVPRCICNDFLHYMMIPVSYLFLIPKSIWKVSFLITLLQHHHEKVSFIAMTPLQHHHSLWFWAWHANLPNISVRLVDYDISARLYSKKIIIFVVKPHSRWLNVRFISTHRGMVV